MNAGPELDAQVMQRVMGWRISPGRYPRDHTGQSQLAVPACSTDITAAWPVAEHFSDVIVEKAGGNYRVTISAAFEADAPTAPLAICLAALGAVGAFEETP